jgi:hypothetical protein
MTALNWVRLRAGNYVANLPADDPSGVSTYRIVHTADRRWEIISIAGMERIRHGSTYTLTSARETVARFYAQKLQWAAQGAAVTG